MSSNWSKIEDLYASGLSMRQVAVQMGMSPTWVAKLVKRFGISRTKSHAAQLRQPPTSKHWRSSRQAARKKMERILGRKLERDEHVHHINHDYTDNRDENLAVLNASEHSKHHHPKNPIPRGQRPQRKAYQKAYWERLAETRTCEECEGSFSSHKYSDQRFCGNSCAQTWKWRQRRATKA